ncbi:hypothetical protein HY29_08865 [Hyphomonas beringensis]|uniref:Uncharacterized protein n=1 Tax=Hyphomonas beringensis TaxID=1280946 RepID=A0A062UF95_9PROT|nr:hypothetical protein [Hyphomonas beringensis]KCZ56393.1 hypothetical protein HY29_08865 [Hyphomonas beringensis]
MMSLISLVRNLAIAAILAWLGLEFAPDQQDASEQADTGTVSILAVGR